MATENEVNAAKVRAFEALAKFLDALTDLAGPLATALRQELDARDRTAAAIKAAERGGRS